MVIKNDKAARKFFDVGPLAAIGVVCVGIVILNGCQEAESAKSTEAVTAAKDGDQGLAAPPAVSSNEEKDKLEATNQKEIKQVKTLKVLKRTDGADKLVGKLKFETGKKTELMLEGDSPEAKQFKSDWEEVVAKGKIPLEVRETKEVDGDMVTEINAVLVGPDEDRYYGAVWSYLEKKYNYLVDVDY
jgi:hypothetical protein